NGGGVEGVDRLAPLDHDVVRGIDDVADRADARGEDAHLDPVGRLSYLDVLDPPADEPRAEALVVDRHGESLADRGPALRHLDARQPDRAAGDRRDLAG